MYFERKTLIKLSNLHYKKEYNGIETIWETRAVAEKHKKRQTARKRMIQLQADESRQKYTMCRKETRKLIKASKRLYERHRY